MRCDHKQRIREIQSSVSSSFSSSSLTSSSYSYRALSFLASFGQSFCMCDYCMSFWTCDDDYDDYDVCKVPSSYCQRWERTVIVEEVLYTFGASCFSCELKGALAVSRKYFKQSK